MRISKVTLMLFILMLITSSVFAAPVGEPGGAVNPPGLTTYGADDWSLSDCIMWSKEAGFWNVENKPTSLSTGGFSGILNNIMTHSEKTYSGLATVGLFYLVLKNLIVFTNIVKEKRKTKAGIELSEYSQKQEGFEYFLTTFGSPIWRRNIMPAFFFCM